MKQRLKILVVQGLCWLELKTSIKFRLIFLDLRMVEVNNNRVALVKRKTNETHTAVIRQSIKQLIT